MHKFDSTQPASHHNPFVVPNGYFADFAAKLMQRIDETDAHTPQMRVMTWIPWIGVACVVALTLLFTQWLPNSNSSSSQVKSEQYAVHQQANEDAVYDYLMMANADNMMPYESDN